ncbi:MAG: APC family permease, partial [Thermoanaerobaculia bacterium]
LSIASGALGFSRYLRYVMPGIPERWESFVAAALCLFVTLFLFRRIGAIGKFSIVLWIGVLLTLGIVIAIGLPHLKLEAFRFWAAPVVHVAGVKPPSGWAGGLGIALLFAVYDYLGYYNICYLAEEVVEPTKTIPRVIVLSIVAVAILYILMNVCVISVLPMERAMTSKSAVSDYVAVLAGSPLAKVVTVLILWTAFASIFSLTLGYSRILYAAARDGNFFQIFSTLHATDGYPYVALGALGCAAALFSFLDLTVVLKAILSIRAVIPFISQIAGALILRRKHPDMPRPFRMWLYPLPAFVALILWGFVLFSPEKGFRATGLVVIGLGTIAFLIRSRLKGEWPWKGAPPSEGAVATA